MIYFPLLFLFQCCSNKIKSSLRCFPPCHFTLLLLLLFAVFSLALFIRRSLVLFDISTFYFILYTLLEIVLFSFFHNLHNYFFFVAFYTTVIWPSLLAGIFFRQMIPAHLNIHYHYGYLHLQNLLWLTTHLNPCQPRHVYRQGRGHGHCTSTRAQQHPL